MIYMHIQPFKCNCMSPFVEMLYFDHSSKAVFIFLSVNAHWWLTDYPKGPSQDLLDTTWETI